MNPKTVGALGIVYVVWGSTYLAIRYAIEGFPPLLSAALRFLAAALLMLGYLAGAVHEGASHSSGIATDLVRRLDTAARFNPDSGTLGAAFERAFGKGYAAGQEGG